MATDRPIQQFRQGNWRGGINTSLPPNEIADDEAVDILNLELDWDGNLVSRNGVVKHQTSESYSTRITSLHDAVYEGVSRPGARFVSFAPILKHDDFPVAPILDRLLAIGRWGMGAGVEIEFAVDLVRRELAFLQLRPLSLSHEAEELAIGSDDKSRIVCSSRSVLGHGRIDDIRDIIVVDRDRFDRATSRGTAAEIAQLNADLAGRPYMLVGVGRWGSADPWLGIPVRWEEISNARVIVEAGFEDIKVMPSQGTHFFQNLVSLSVGYFTVNPDVGEGFVDWGWLMEQPVVRALSSVRHVRCAEPLVVKMNGKSSEGVVLKPG